MGAGNRQRVMPNAERSKHLGTVPDGKVASLCFFKLRVVLQDGGGNHYHIGLKPFKVGGALTDENLHTCFAQLLSVTAFAQVGTGYLHTLFLGNARNAAHANSANADKMYFVNAMLRHG